MTQGPRESPMIGLRHEVHNSESEDGITENQRVRRLSRARSWDRSSRSGSISEGHQSPEDEGESKKKVDWYDAQWEGDAGPQADRVTTGGIDRGSQVAGETATPPVGSDGQLPFPRSPLSATPTSITNFEIIEPISKGAFGSVFLTRRKATGDYFAIKVVKKADMVTKNQVTKVKAKRMILMQQDESPFVVKLYWTFQSKENLYLVMEYLNGGDCAALIKNLGSLPEEWTKNYVAEIVLGLEYLHQRGVVHR